MKLSLFRNLILLFSGSILLTGCPGDPCKDKTCPENTQCITGDCECEPPYQWDADSNCVLIVSEFEADWNATDSCSLSGEYDDFTVSAEVVNNKVFWTNLYEVEEITTATLSSDGQSCTIDAGQTVDGFPVSGTCTLQSDGTAIFDYQLQWTAAVDSCSMHLSK